MKRVSKRRLCPICDKHDWCLVAEDGSAAICARVSEGSTKRVGDAGWLHQLRPGAIPRPPLIRRVESAARPAVDCAGLMRGYRERISRRQVAMLARTLGVSASGLDRLGVGWDGEAFAFPMRDERGAVIGIRRRFASGRKVCVPGSRNGLFVPDGLTGEGPLVIGEGPTDTAAALDLGFDAVGRPNCNSKVKMTVRYAAGRAVVIAADNDPAGIAGARILAEALATRGSRVRIVAPPAELKEQALVLRYYNQQAAWCAYTGAGYEICPPVDMQNRVWRFAERCVVLSGGENSGPKPLNCTENTIKNTLSAMASFEAVEVPSAVTAPAWLDGRDGPDPEYVISLENGLLDVSGEPVLLEHTPAFLNFNILPYAYDPGAECPEWLTFLGQVFANKQLSSTETEFDTEAEDFIEVEERVPDEEKIQSLQEWFGLLLTTETRYHKMLGIIGPKRSGKGTIGRVLTALIGKANVATPTFASMVESFGLQGLLNARVAIFGDANMDKDPVVVGRAVEKLKSISGEDGVDVNRKYERVIQGARLKVRFVMISNNLQRLTDPTGTVSDRFIFLQTTQSFYGKEDLGLEARLMGELPGILNWAIAGLKRLNARGHLLEPAESVDMRTRSKELGSNVIAFVDGGCRRGEGLWTRPDDMYDAFKRWCDGEGCQPMKKGAFREALGEAFPEHACNKHRLGPGENPVWVYWGVEPLSALSYA